MQEHWAGLWEHVDDLRKTLLRSFVVIGVGFLFLLMFYQPIFQFLTSYLQEHTEEGLLKQKVQRIQVINQTTREQLFELPSHAWLVTPFEQSKNNSYRLAPGQALLYEEAIHAPLLIMSPIEGLILIFKACFWLSLVLTAPFWGWIWLQFILPGLREQERVMLIPFLLSSVLCLGMGMTFAYYVTLPIANQYLLTLNQGIGQNAWTLTHYVNYVLLLCLGHAIAAELALLLFLLVHFRLLSPDWLISKRRYMIVLAFIIGAILTPPDVLTQMILAIPLLGFYELAILYAKWLHRSAIAEREAEEII